MVSSIKNRDRKPEICFLGQKGLAGSGLINEYGHPTILHKKGSFVKPSAVVAFCPGHISGYFKRVSGDSPASTGSIGAGIVISEGVTATVSHSDEISVEIQQAGHPGPVTITKGSPLLASALEKLDITASVVTECRLPIGAGFGMSAAALLSSLTAVNRLLGLGLSPRQIALHAHEEEVLHRTGLGDVAACQGGGLVIRKEPGIDGLIERRFDLKGPLYSVSYGPIHTPEILGSESRMHRISGAFPTDTPGNPVDFFRICRQFAESSGLVTPEVRIALGKCDETGVPASMTMLGNGIFACGKRAGTVLASLGNAHEFRVSESGVRIIGDLP